MRGIEVGHQRAGAARRRHDLVDEAGRLHVGVGQGLLGDDGLPAQIVGGRAVAVLSVGVPDRSTSTDKDGECRSSNW